jgi:hypothetical protein
MTEPVCGTWPIRFALHLNPGFFAPHFVLIAAQGAFALTASHLQLPGVTLMASMVLLAVGVMPPHRIIVEGDTVKIRHWLWTWRLKRADFTEVGWEEKERYLTGGHARGSSLLALRAPVRALSLRRRCGPSLLLFGEETNLKQVEEALGAHTSCVELSAACPKSLPG